MLHWLSVKQSMFVVEPSVQCVMFLPLFLRNSDKNKLIVRDIPDNVDEEFLSTLVESRLGLEYMKRTLLWTLETNVQL